MTDPSFAQFLERINTLPNVHTAFWKDSDLLCLYAGKKEFAHFHGQTVIDIRLTPKLIAQEGLSREISTRLHPNRSLKSRWIAIPCATIHEQDRALSLIELAAAL
jgi:hypothetical protein